MNDPLRYGFRDLLRDVPPSGWISLVLLVLLAALMIFALREMGAEERACRERGGELVQGLWDWHCVERRP